MALMLVTTTRGDFAADDRSVDTGGEFALAYLHQRMSASLHRNHPCVSDLLTPVCRGSFRPFFAFATSVSVGLGPSSQPNAVLLIVTAPHNAFGLNRGSLLRMDC